MSGKHSILIFRPGGRDTSPLISACQTLNLLPISAETEEQLCETLGNEAVCCVVVAVDREGQAAASEFATLADQNLNPEDSDLQIIYSTEGTTPAPWEKDKLDPRLIKPYDDYGPFLLTGDKDWSNTIRSLKELSVKLTPVVLPKHPVAIGLTRGSDVSFPTEAAFLMRAFFSNMSNVTIEFPRQGLSGSISCVVTPVDLSGAALPQVFVKIYRGQEEAGRDLTNFTTYVKGQLEELSFPNYDVRRYQGRRYSLLVTDLVQGPSKRAMTFKEMVMKTGSENFSVAQVRDFVAKTLTTLDNGKEWQYVKKDCDLLDAYLKKVFDKPKMQDNLESENACHRWFGTASENVALPERLRKWLSSRLSGKYTKRCHGDLHADNIMVRDTSMGLSPVLIDFSRTGPTHPLKDLVTLESDMIIRGLGGVSSFSNSSTVQSFLVSINDIRQRDINMWTYDADEVLLISRILAVIDELRKNATVDHKVPLSEYQCAALLKTLEVLSYGSLAHEQNVRAATYVTYLVDKLGKDAGC